MKIKPRQKTGKGMVVVLVVAVFLAVVIVPSLAGASQWPDARQIRGGMPGKGHHRSALGLWQNQQLVDQLGLSEEQVRRLRDADFASRENRLELKTRHDQLGLQMDKAFSHEASDHKAVRQLAQEMAGIKGQMFVQQIEDRLTLRTILTPDQIKKLERDRMHGKRRGIASRMRPDANVQ